MESIILLENMVFHAKHGVFAQENIVGNTFIVNLKIKTSSLSEAFINDDIEDTLNYADVYDIVKEEMAIPSKLLEHVGYRIIKRLKGFSEKVTWVELKISKQNPPVDGQVEYASVILTD